MANLLLRGLNGPPYRSEHLLACSLHRVCRMFEPLGTPPLRDSLRDALGSRAHLVGVTPQIFVHSDRVKALLHIYLVRLLGLGGSRCGCCSPQSGLSRSATCERAAAATLSDETAATADVALQVASTISWHHWPSGGVSAAAAHSSAKAAALGLEPLLPVLSRPLLRPPGTEAPR